MHANSENTPKIVQLIFERFQQFIAPWNKMFSSQAGQLFFDYWANILIHIEFQLLFMSHGAPSSFVRCRSTFLPIADKNKFHR